MRTFILLFIVASALTACVSSKGHLNKGNYDMAIKKAVKKLKRNPKNEKQILVLEKAYKSANEEDKERINFLKLEGNPDIWDDVYQTYLRMKGRQAIVKKVLPLKISRTGRLINYEYINYDEEIIQAKRKAAEYSYAHGISLLEKGGRENARMAYNDFMNVKKLFSDYKDIDSKTQQALYEGTSHVLFKIKNKSGTPLPQAFENELTKTSLNDLNQLWLNFHTQEDKNLYYDYTIFVNLKIIDVSPEGIKEVYFNESKQVQDGFEYVLDDKGNVKKDSLGNDLKNPKFKTIICKVIETQQRKSARISGTIDFIDNATKQLIKTDPVTADSFFENNAALAIGDVNALTPETKKRLGNQPLPFPHDSDMIMRCAGTMKEMVKGILVNNKHLLR